MRNLLILFCICFSIQIQAQGIQFFKGNLEELYTKAEKEGKPIFIDAYTTWCGPCKYMTKNIFPDQKVGDFYNKNFISYKLDMEKGEGKEFAKNYAVRSYPTLLFLNHTGEVLYRAVGSRESGPFIDLGQEAADPTKQLHTLKKKYAAGDRSKSFLKDYVDVMYAGNTLDAEVRDEFISKVTTADLKNPKYLETFLYVNQDVTNPKFQYIAKNKDVLNGLVPDLDIDDFLSYIYTNNLMAAKMSGNQTKEQMILDNMPLEKNAKAEIITYSGIQSNLRSEKPDFNALTTLANTYFKKYNKNDGNLRNSIAWMFFENADKLNKKQLKKAAKWSKQSLAIDKNYAYTDTYAALLYALGKKSKALGAAMEAIQIAKKNGDNPKETEALLKKIKMLK